MVTETWFPAMEATMSRPLRTLITLSVLLGVFECAAAVGIAVQDHEGLSGGFFVFAVLFFVGAFLMRMRRVVAGGMVVGLLCLIEVASFPTLQRHTAYDWVSQSVFGVVALGTLVLTIGILASRRRSRAVTD
jgi:hypothetical protein